MEGVGARFGRQSTRYGPTTVFTGPVRRWKKKWIHVSSVKKTTVTNGGVNGNNNGSHLMFLKWTPITNNNNTSSTEKDIGEDGVVSIDEPRKRKFKLGFLLYLSNVRIARIIFCIFSLSQGLLLMALLEDLKDESDQDEDEAEPVEADANTGKPTSQADDCDEKPDINDVPMEENQDPEDKPPERQDLNESTLDLSLGFTAHEENDADSKTNQTKDGKLDRVNSSSTG
ncbi:uncharacterized protein LOC132614046 isoform X2 [Lycium barbarum]|uniref:uncharacterized protein LOC132614046 isoform X2 n=1 Tax=Lycium barbarum TaxID=112863 RepID=UPI00293F03C4|nr:uncharacterized protein LOC132614046 isoform X2 [Lycium barbarum]